MKTFFSAILMASCWISMLPAHIIHVPHDQPGIQAGINAAVNGDTVLVADSTYYENINFFGKAITVASYFLIDSDSVHIDSTIIDGSEPSNPDNGSVIFFVTGEDTTSVLCGFTITGGSGTETSYMWDDIQIFCRTGGGILCYNSGARILNNKITNNTVYSPDKEVYGGGVAAVPFGSTAFVILKDNTISHNTVTADMEVVWSGGVDLQSNGILLNNRIDHNTVIHNATYMQAGAGGLTCFSDTSDRREVIIESNTFINNSAIGHSNTEGIPNIVAGGILIQGSRGRFSKNDVSQNELWANSDRNACGAGMLILDIPDSFIINGNIIQKNTVMRGKGWGGGINISDCSPCMTNNIIVGNSATNGGGFLIAFDTQVQIINNNIMNNQATYGGGIYISNSANPVLINSIIWNNTGVTNAGIHVQSGNVHVAYCDIQGDWGGTGNIDKDPLFVDPVIGNFALTEYSPCVGQGTLSIEINGLVCTCPATDYNDNQRPAPVDEFVDIGAIESEFGITGIDHRHDIHPEEFTIEQNYPNPFNPSTVISWQLAVGSKVELSIYNILGQKIETILNKHMPAGYHEVEFNGQNLSSGIYLYKIEAGKWQDVRKMVLIK